MLFAHVARHRTEHHPLSRSKDGEQKIISRVKTHHAASCSHADAAHRDLRLATRAANALKARQLRASIFRQPIFGEPAWDMLIALYLADIEGRRVTASGLADWAQCPKTTALRWQHMLEDRQLITRAANPVDARMQFISLTELGRDALNEFFRLAPVI